MNSALFYTPAHEWFRQNGELVTVGITDYGQEQLGEIVFVELPKTGAHITAGNSFCVIESVKAASEIICPFGGKIIEHNKQLLNTPQIINESPLDLGWICVVQPTDERWSHALLSQQDYLSLIGIDKTKNR